MALGYKFKHYLFNAFRELFIYHHSSLEFRAKLFALVIAANEHSEACDYNTVKSIGMAIYNDEDRSNTLTLTTQEFVEKIRQSSGIDVDTLIHDIVQELKVIPRYAKKIDVDQLRQLISCNDDPDTVSYQKSIIAFLERLKRDYEQRP